MPVRPADLQPPLAVTDGGVPVIEADVPAVDIPPAPSPGEPGAHEFGRDLAVWTSRLFDQPVTSLRYRENPADHGPCPRARTYELAVAGHLILVTAYDSHPHHQQALTVYGVHVDGVPVPFIPRRPAVRLQWQLAWAAWHAVKDVPRR